MAEKEGVRILIEPEPSLLIESSSQFLKFIRDIPSEFIGLNFDIGHFYCVREDPAELVSKLAEHTAHFHLEDINAGRVHNHLIPGLGAIDFREIFRAIDQTGYDGFVTVELYPYQDNPEYAARSAFDYLKSIIK
jgi:sugar phosphate isomerase/epimerase